MKLDNRRPMGGPARALLFGGGQSYLDKLLGIQPSNLIGLWPLRETSGGVAVDASPEGNDGAYTSVTLNATPFKNGDPAPQFDGVNSFVDVHSAALNTDFDGAELTMSVWFQMLNAGVWTDSTLRYLMVFAVSTSNEIHLFRTTTDNELKTRYEAGGTAVTVAFTDAGGSIAWHNFTMTISALADEMKTYLDGAQVGATQTGLGTWAGDLASDSALLGARNTSPASVQNGYLAYGALWKTPLTDAEVLSLGTV